jgi:hypothetical protein
MLLAMARRLGIGGRWTCCLLAFCVSVVCSGCAAAASGSSHASSASGASAQSACLYGLEATGDSVATARAGSHSRAACSGIARLCRWSIAFSQFRTHTDPGTFADEAPGSCPSRERDAVLQLAARIRLSGTHGAGLCSLLINQELANAQRVATASHVSCGEGALQTGLVSYRQLSQPVAGIILFSSRPGPPHWFGYLGFANPVYKTLAPHQSPPPGTPVPVDAAITKRPDGSWAIVQIPYEP